MLNPIAPDLWEYQRPLRVGLIPFPRRTTVARLADGSLWVHNVNALDRPGAAEALDALGPVRHVVAPNKFHHAAVDAWRERYPDATIYAAPGLAEKKPGLPIDQTLDPTSAEAWGGALEALQTRGHPALEEVVFFHRASKSLIVTDWVFHIGPEQPWSTRTLFRINGCYRRMRPSRLFRALAKDRAAVRASTEEICERWAFERVVMAHGLVTPAGPDELRAAFADL